MGINYVEMKNIDSWEKANDEKYFMKNIIAGRLPILRKN